MGFTDCAGGDVHSVSVQHLGAQPSTLGKSWAEAERRCNKSTLDLDAKPFILVLCYIIAV